MTILIFLNDVIDGYTVKRTSQQWVASMNEAGVPCGPIYSIDQTFADEQVTHLKMTAEIEHATLGRQRLVRQPVNLSRTPASVRRATPDCGEHTTEVLEEIGLSQGEIESMQKKAVI